MSRVLLLSGGVDSACIAAWQRPEHCLSINYGQKAAAAEQRSAAAIAAHLELSFTHITVDAAAASAAIPSPGPASDDDAVLWWPYRNQLLITLAAAWAVAHGHIEVLIGTVAGDGDRHADGRQEFYDAMTALLQVQEGSLAVAAPAISLSTPELIDVSAVDDSTLGWTHSCHLGDVPCSRCAGCTKRAEVLLRAGRLQ
ncbi:7-cyano-7-deazaguanine synthase [Nocardioides sp. LMS-CY]|nr:7-cyano-7-deazaguanine synthase [Nocardioides sp. LMS-CY]